MFMTIPLHLHTKQRQSNIQELEAMQARLAQMEEEKKQVSFDP
jgi:hypothetical protein